MASATGASICLAASSFRTFRRLSRPYALIRHDIAVTVPAASGPFGDCHERGRDRDRRDRWIVPAASGPFGDCHKCPTRFASRLLHGASSFRTFRRLSPEVRRLVEQEEAMCQQLPDLSAIVTRVNQIQPAGDLPVPAASGPFGDCHVTVRLVARLLMGVGASSFRTFRRLSHGS